MRDGGNNHSGPPLGTTILASLILGLVACGPPLADAQTTRVPDDARRGCGLTPDEVNEGWIALFDGTSLFGWAAESDANWRVEDGAIVADDGSAPGLLRTTSQFDNYRLRLEFQCDPATNSGVFLRTSPRPTDPAIDCFEWNIAPEANPFPTGSIVGRQKTPVAIEDWSGQAERWHQLEVRLDGDELTTWVDGQQTARLAGALPTGRGYVGLQFNQGRVRFRNIKLLPLHLPDLTDPVQENWLVGDQAGPFSISDSPIIAVRGGPGQMESRGQFADLILSGRCRTNATGSNSGLFFRCIPGEALNGYEIQIDNTTVDGDDGLPRNSGTGAIFRRSEARRVIPVDQQWFMLTAIAVGPRIAVWVNGFQVTDWVDHREPNANPRRGLRTAAGTIMLQAHDAETDVAFSEIRCRELDMRRKSK